MELINIPEGETNSAANILDFVEVSEYLKLAPVDGTTEEVSGIKNIYKNLTNTVFILKLVPEATPPNVFNIEMTGSIDGIEIETISRIQFSAQEDIMITLDTETVSPLVSIEFQIIIYQDESTIYEILDITQNIQMFRFNVQNPNDYILTDENYNVEVFGEFVNIEIIPDIVILNIEYNSENLANLDIIPTNEQEALTINCENIVFDDTKTLIVQYEAIIQNTETLNYSINTGYKLKTEIVDIIIGYDSLDLKRNTLSTYTCSGVISNLTEEQLGLTQLTIEVLQENDDSNLYNISIDTNGVWQMEFEYPLISSPTVDLKFKAVYSLNEIVNTITFNLSHDFIFINTIKVNEIDPTLARLYLTTSILTDVNIVCDGLIDGNYNVVDIETYEYYKNCYIDVPYDTETYTEDQLQTGFSTTITITNVILVDEIPTNGTISTTKDYILSKLRNVILGEEQILDSSWVDILPNNSYTVGGDSYSQWTQLGPCSFHKAYDLEGELPYEMNKITSDENQNLLLNAFKIIEEVPPLIRYTDVLSVRSHLKHIIHNFTLNDKTINPPDLTGLDEDLDYSGLITEQDYKILVKFVNKLYTLTPDGDKDFTMNEQDVRKGNLIYRYTYNEIIDLYNLTYRSCICNADCDCNLVCSCNTACHCNYSDIRLKEDLKFIKNLTVQGIIIPWYSFKYKNDKETIHEGVIAQDLIKAGLNQYVEQDKEKYYMVNYDLLQKDTL